MVKQMSKYDLKAQLVIIQQRLINIIDYVLTSDEVDEKVKEKILELANPEVYKKKG